MTFFVVMIASLFSCESSDLDDFVLPPDALELKTLLLDPIQDAYLQDEQGYNRTIIRVEQDKRTSYLKFDLRPVDGVIEDVRLTLTVDSDEGEGILKVYKAENVQWSEANLSAANAPASTDLLSEANRKYRLGESTSFRLNRYYLNSEVTTIKLEHNEGNDMAFASRENPNSTGPKLEVKYWVPTDTPDSDTTEEESEASEDDPAGDETGSEESGNSDGGSDSGSGDSSEGGSPDGSGDSGSSGGDDSGSSGGDDSGSSGGDDSGSTGGSDSGSGDSSEGGSSDGSGDSGSTGGSDSGSGDSSDSDSTGGNDSGSTGGGTGGSDSGSTSGNDSGSTGGDQSSSGTNGGNAPEGSYIVTPQGSWNADGKTEATAWSIERALEMAVAGDVVYIKAGNYGDRELEVENSGSSNNPIRFIGYKNEPGDIRSENGSTFEYGDAVSTGEMPLIQGSSPTVGVGLDIMENHIIFENFQISQYNSGIRVTGNNVTLRNLVVEKNGEQNNNNSQTGRGIQLFGDFGLIENCFVLNANAEGINLKGSVGSAVRGTAVYSDNVRNPGGYYLALTGGARNNTIDNCLVYRNPNADLHRGHGLVLKDLAVNNTIKNCITYNTGIEVNFSGVEQNTFESIVINGSYSSDNSEFSSNIRVINGAHDNYFRNITINDARYAINFHDFNDGFRARDADRDLQQGGNNNVFEGIQVNTAKHILVGTSQEVGANATSRDNIVRNSTFENITSTPFVSYQTITGTEIINSTFIGIPSRVLVSEYNGGSMEIRFEGGSYSNVGFRLPE